MYEEFLGRIKDPMIILSQSKLLFHNEAARNMLGITDTNFMAKMSEVLNDKGESLEKYLEKLVVDQSVEPTKVLQERYNYHNLNKTDSIHRTQILMATLIPSLNLSGERLVALALHDATEEILQEEKRVEGKYKNMMLFSLSHELRTPLNIFQGFINISKEYMKSELAKEIRRNAKGAWCYLKNKINDILDYAQIMSNEFGLHYTRFSLARFFAYMRKMTTCLLEEKQKSIRLLFEVNDNVTDEFIGDRERLEQILFNLLSNAVKYTSAGMISMKVKHPNNDKRLLEFCVADTGCGMSSAKVNELFQLRSDTYINAAKSSQLSGLGLTASRMICNMMGTDIKVDSELGKGTTFFFTIFSDVHAMSGPLLDSATCDSPVIPSEGTIENFTRSLCNIHHSQMNMKSLDAVKNLILIVDDNGLNRYVVKSMIQKFNIKTEEAENGLIAFEMTEKITKNRDLKNLIILMDVSMPVMDGIEATIEIKAKIRSHCPINIVALTAFSSELERIKCFESGMDYFLSKPITKDKLKMLLEKYNFL